MLRQAVRRFTTSSVRFGHYPDGPGKNIPFSVENKWRFLGVTVLFVGSAFIAPSLLVKHQLGKS